MARKRMIDPEFFLDEELCALSAHARLLYIGLWGICDDNYATLPNRPEWIKAQIFPYEEVSILELLSELAKNSKIIAFDWEGKEYWYIKNFFKFQRVDRPSSPKYPPYPHMLVEDSSNTRPEVKLSKDKLSKDNSASVQSFEEFWNLYPNKVNKKRAWDKWTTLTPFIQKQIIEVLPKQCDSPSWKKDGGRFIPHPTTYLNGERWNDEVRVQQANYIKI